jgi:hypothetical protein
MSSCVWKVQFKSALSVGMTHQWKLLAGYSVFRRAVRSLLGVISVALKRSDAVFAAGDLRADICTGLAATEHS